MTEQEIQQKARDYADNIVPNPSKYDAPFYTTKDFHNDLMETFIDGAKWMQEQDKWISIEDRLPETTGKYVIWSSKYDEIVIDVFVKSSVDAYFCHSYATHWQPLPSPPKTK